MDVPLWLWFAVLGGMVWGAIPALLKTEFGVSEILTSLMLNYAIVQLLGYLLRGPWRDPKGMNFPTTASCADC